MTARRIAIVGCRPPPGIDPTDSETYRAILRDVGAFVWETVRARGDDWTIVSGGADGVDTDAVECASGAGVASIIHLPDYAKHGRAAPLVRNALIVADCDELHAWPAPWSRGGGRR